MSNPAPHLLGFLSIQIPEEFTAKNLAVAESAGELTTVGIKASATPSRASEFISTSTRTKPNHINPLIKSSLLTPQSQTKNCEPRTFKLLYLVNWSD
jgi:hypothetical protein